MFSLSTVRIRRVDQGRINNVCRPPIHLRRYSVSFHWLKGTGFSPSSRPRISLPDSRTRRTGRVFRFHPDKNIPSADSTDKRCCTVADRLFFGSFSCSVTSRDHRTPISSSRDPSLSSPSRTRRKFQRWRVRSSILSCIASNVSPQDNDAKIYMATFGAKEDHICQPTVY